MIRPQRRDDEVMPSSKKPGPFRSSRHPEPDPVADGQESVWEYPRPPAIEATARLLRVELGGQVVGESARGVRVLETSHPPTYYVPLADCDAALFTEAHGRSFCEWKGVAQYFTVAAGGVVAEAGAWTYTDPSPTFRSIVDHVAFYPSVFSCFVDGEAVRPQPGGFYGGWITSQVAGPCKGEPGTEWW